MFASPAQVPQIIDITDQICHIAIPDREQLARTFGRPQEYYESPLLHGSVFTFEEMIAHYHAQGFDYLQQVNGYNLPSWTLKPFRDGAFDPLSEHERLLLRLDEEKSRYFVGTRGADRTDLKHEIAHGLWATVPGYCTDMTAIIGKLTETQQRGIRKHLEGIDGMGYHASVITDEIHAYILTDPETISSAPNPDIDNGNHQLFCPVIEHQVVVELQQEMERVFDAHFAEHRRVDF